MAAMRRSLIFALLVVLSACSGGDQSAAPTLRWYVAEEGSGAFETAARRCGEASNGAFRIELAPLPADADQQREQLVRRLAAHDRDIDIIGMDVIWTPEFAQAGWILPWRGEAAERAREGRLAAPLQSATYKGGLWAVPFTTNAQLLWYRTDRVPKPPKTWDEMVAMAEPLGARGTIQAQGERYEGLTVFFVSLLASAGGDALSLEDAAVHRALT